MALTKVTGHVVKSDTNVHTHNINSSGIITAINLDVTGNVSIGGTLTYQDVTSVDSVGIITAQAGINVTGGTLKIPTATNAQNNANLNILYQGDGTGGTTAGVIDSDAGLKYNPAEDTLKVNGNLLSSTSLYGAGGTLKLAASNHSSTNYVLITNKVELGGNIGINTSVPLSGLHISDGTVYGVPQNSSRKATLTISAGSEGSADIQLLSANYNHIFFGDAADPNTGIIHYEHTGGGTDNMVFSTAGSQRLRIHENGAISAGVDNNSYELTLQGMSGGAPTLWLRDGTTTGNPRIIFGDTGAATRSAIYHKNSNDSLNFYTNGEVTAGDERLTITSAGNIGIGEASPDSKLHISGGSNENITLKLDPGGTAGNYSQLVLGRTSGAPAIQTTPVVKGGIPISGVSGILFGSENTNLPAIGFQTPNSANGHIVFKPKGSEKLRITAGGFTHIGNPTVTNAWDTHAISLATNSATFACPATVGIFGGTGYGTANMAGGGIRFVGYYDSSNFTTFAHVAGIKENTTSGEYGGALTFHTRQHGNLGAERLRITSTGNVCINDSNPSAQLVVKATSDDNPALQLFRASTGGDIASIVWETNAGAQAKINYRGAAGASEGLQFYTAGGSSSQMRMLIDHSGKVGIGSDDPTSQLDIKRANVSGTYPNGNAKPSGASIYNDGGDIFTGRLFLQGWQRGASSDFLTGMNNEGNVLVLYNYGSSKYMQKWHKNAQVELYHDNHLRLNTTTQGTKIGGHADTVLLVEGTSTASRIDLKTSSHHRFWQTLESDGRFRFYDQTNNAERLCIDTSGCLRIGNTPTQTTSNTTKRIALGAKGSIWGWTTGNINGCLTLADNYYWDGANNKIIESDFAGYLSLRSGTLRFGSTDSSQTAGANSTGIHESFRVGTGGDLWARKNSVVYLVLGNSGDATGDGTTPNNNMNWIRGNATNVQYNCNGGFHAWEINGSEKMKINGANLELTSATQCRLTMGSNGTAGSNDSNWIRGDGDNLMFNCCDDGDHIWETNGTQRMTLNTGGKLLLGTTRTYYSNEYYDDITINNTGGSAATGGSGVTLLSNSGSWGALIFGDQDDDDIGYIKYDHGNDRILIATDTGIAAHVTNQQRWGLGLDAPEAVLHPRANPDHGTDTAFQVGTGNRFFKLTELSGQDNFSNCYMSFYDNSLREILTLENTYAGVVSMGMEIAFRGYGGKTGHIQVYNTAVNSTNSEMALGASGGTALKINHDKIITFDGKLRGNYGVDNSNGNSNKVASGHSQAWASGNVSGGLAVGWYPIIHLTDGCYLFLVKTGAHSSMLFTASNGYDPSNLSYINVLHFNHNPNSSYLNIDGVRATSDGVIEVHLNASSSDYFYMEAQVIGAENIDNSLMFYNTLTKNTGSPTINDSKYPLTYQGYGGAMQVENLRIDGTLSKNAGSFRIPHPLPALKDTKDLSHSFIEGPQCDNIYRGKIDLVDGTATVNLDTKSNMTEGTFVVLNRDVQCYTTNETGWTNVKGSVSGNTLTITAQDNSCTDTISWMVVGERQDDSIKSEKCALTDGNGSLIVEQDRFSNSGQAPNDSKPNEI